MIRCVIQAGFGNQLFQYATAYALARELNQPLELDCTFFDWYNRTHPDTARNCAMELLALDGNHTIISSGVAKYWRYQPLLSLKFSYLPWYPGGLPVIREDITDCRKDQRHLFRKIGKRGAVVFGFWQNTCYFDKYLSDLQRQFKPAYILPYGMNELCDEVSGCESVGVHVRRGDFVKLGWDKSARYYRTAIAEMRLRVESPEFYIVSDDPDWCRHTFTDSDCRVLDIQSENRDLDEFFMLSQCHHQIISESTFGWWAAYLNQNPDKTIAIPADAKGDIFNALQNAFKISI